MSSFRSPIAPIRWMLAALHRRAMYASTSLFLGAASLVGLETLILLFEFSTMWPVGIPLIVLSLGAVFFLRTWGAAARLRLRVLRRARRVRRLTTPIPASGHVLASGHVSGNLGHQMGETCPLGEEGRSRRAE